MKTDEEILKDIRYYLHEIIYKGRVEFQIDLESGVLMAIKEARDGYVNKKEIRKWQRKWNKEGIVNTDMDIKLTKLLEEK